MQSQKMVRKKLGAKAFQDQIYIDVQTNHVNVNQYA